MFRNISIEDVCKYDSKGYIIINYGPKQIERHKKNCEAQCGAFGDIIQSLSGDQKLVFVNAGNKEERNGTVHELLLQARERNVSVYLSAQKGDEFSYRLRRFEPKLIDNFAEEDEYKVEMMVRVVFLDECEDARDYLINNNVTAEIKGELEKLRERLFALTPPLRIVEAAKFRRVWRAYVEGERILLERKRSTVVVKEVRYEEDKKGKYVHVTIDRERTNSKKKTQLEQCLSNYNRYDIKQQGEDLLIAFDGYVHLSEKDAESLQEWCENYHYDYPEAIEHHLIGELALKQSDELLKEVEDIFYRELDSCSVMYEVEAQKGACSNRRLYILDETKEEQLYGIFESLKNRGCIPQGYEFHRGVNIIQFPIEVCEVPSRFSSLSEISCQQGRIIVKASFPIDFSQEKYEGLAILQVRGIFTFSAEGVNIEDVFKEVSDKDLKLDLERRRLLADLASPKRLKVLFSKINSVAPSVKSEYIYVCSLDVKSDLIDLRSSSQSEGVINVSVVNNLVEIYAETEANLEQRHRSVKENIPSYLTLGEPVVGFNKYYIIDAPKESKEQDRLDWECLNEILTEFRNNCFEYSLSRTKYQINFTLLFDNIEEREKHKAILRVAIENSSLQEKVDCKWLGDDGAGMTLISLNYNEALEVEYNKQLHTDSRDEIVSLQSSDKDKYGNEQQRYRSIGRCIRRNLDMLTVELFQVDTEIEPGSFLCFQFHGETMNIDRQLAAMAAIQGESYRNSKGKTVEPMSLANPKLKDFLFDPRRATAISFKDVYLVGVDDLESATAYIKQTAIEPNINTKQCEAVARALFAEDIAIIQGPPGTGKTTVIAEMIYQEIKRNPSCKILLTSQTNLAVDNALERLKGKANIRPLRILPERKIERSDASIYTERMMGEWVNGKLENRTCVLSEWIERIDNKAQSAREYDLYIEELSPWLESLRNSDEKFREKLYRAYMSGVNLVAATCSICGNYKLFKETCARIYQTQIKDVFFDVVIIDEASKATPLELAIPMVLGKKIILIGDHKQLPAMLSRDDLEDALDTQQIDSDLQEQVNLIAENPQFKHIFMMAQKFNPSIVSSLDVQYRMHQDIMNTISHIYRDDIDGGLQCGILADMDDPNILTNKASRYHGLKLEPFISPAKHAIWINVNTPERKEGTSYLNEGEAKAVTRVLERLQCAEGFKAYQETRLSREDREIAVITFYGKQAGRLQAELKGKFSELLIRRDVVDNFQGMERDIVIVSTVRSNRTGNLGFAKDIERINVAFSRARRLLIVVGNKQLFSRHPIYAESIRNMHQINLNQL